MKEYQDLKIDIAKQQFKQINDKFEKIIQTTSPRKIDIVYGKEFGNLYMNALEGDLSAQDYLGYIFKRGRKNLVPENIELSMSWQVLAAANGNQYTIERLAIFLNSAYDKIFALEDFEYISYAFRITNNNYQFVIGKLICQAICDELSIQEDNIITDIPDTLLYNATTMYKFNNAKEKAIDVVIDYMRKTYMEMKQFSNLKKAEEQQDKPKEQVKEKKSFWNNIFKKEKQDKN